jgi:hypothetical protein
MSGEEPHILDMVDGSNDEGENHPLLLSLNFRVKAMEMLTQREWESIRKK